MARIRRPSISSDPSIAAELYLSGIPAAARALAAARTGAEEGRLVFGWVMSGVLLAALLKTPFLVRLRAVLNERVSSEGVASFLCVAAFVLIWQLFQIAVTLVAQAVWPLGSVETAGSLIAGMVLALLIGVPLILLVQAVATSAPRWGWTWLGFAASVLIFGAILVPPVATLPGARGDRPISGPAAARMLTFVQHGGLKAPQMYVFSDRDPLAVDAEGLGSIVHAAASQAALDQLKPEAFAAMGHLLGHHQHHDLWSMAALWSILVCTLLFAMFRLYAPFARRVGFGLPETLSGPAGLPVLGLMVWAFLLIATPAFNLFDQAINYRADDYAMSLTRDPDALCRWLVATEQGSKADPSMLEAFLFYDHPPLEARLKNAARWKMQHGL